MPGAPLCYLSDGFERMFGHGRERLGTNCKFTQGPDTESYLVDEIVDALRCARPMVVKLTNHRKSGEAFQTLLALYPVFGAPRDGVRVAPETLGAQ